MEGYMENSQQPEMIHNHSVTDLQYLVEKKWDVYKKKFHRMDSGGMSMNWCAALFGCIWAAYRKMWKNAFILLGIELFNTILATVITLLLGNTAPALFLRFIFLIAVIALCGLLGDKMYFNHVCRTLDTYELKKRAGSTDASSYLTKHSGTSGGYAIAMLLLRGALVYLLRILVTYLAVLILYSVY